MANWKATHARKQPEGDTRHNNNLKATHAIKKKKQTYKRHTL